MIYSEYKGFLILDKVAKQIFKITKDAESIINEKNIKTKLQLFNKKTVEEIEESKILGYINGSSVFDFRHNEDTDYFKLSYRKYYMYTPIVAKKKFNYTKGYIQVSKTEFIGVQGSLFFIFFLILATLGIILGLIYGIRNRDGIVQIGGTSTTEIQENDKVINLDAIPEDTKELDITQDMAYISGQSLTLVKSSYPNVYLTNDEANDKYTLVYEVYVNGSDSYSYKTGHIPAGSAEPDPRTAMRCGFQTAWMPWRDPLRSPGSDRCS